MKNLYKAYIGPSIFLFLGILVSVHPRLYNLVFMSIIQWALLYWITCFLQFPRLWEWIRSYNEEGSPREKLYRKAEQAYEAYEAARRECQAWEDRTDKIIAENRAKQSTEPKAEPAPQRRAYQDEYGTWHLRD